MKFLFILSLCLLSITAFPQKKMLTVRDTEVGARRELASLTMQNLQWRGTTTFFTFQDAFRLYQLSAMKSDTTVLMDLSSLNRILKQGNTDTLLYFPTVTWGNDNEFYFYTPDKWICIDLTRKNITAVITFPEKASNFTLYYPARRIAYTVENNVYVSGPGNQPVRVTSDDNKEIVNGDVVSRNEFGITEGLFWSPQGDYLAFYRKDNSKVGNYPLVDITSREATLENIKYPMAGMPSERVSLGIYELSSKNTVFIEKQDTVSEKYLTNISWSPDSKSIYIQVLNREQNHMRMNRYRVQDGALEKTLFEEKNDRYVEPLNKILFLNKNKNRFVYQSRRDGFNHAYIYDTEGKLIKQLTSGSWEILSIENIDSQDNIYYTSTEASPLETQGYVINAETSRKTRMTTDPGTHRMILSKNNKFWIDDFSNIRIPHQINLMTAKGTISRNLLTSPNRLAVFNMPEMKIGTLKAADGVTDLYYRLIKPADFDSTKKYPAIIYVYGGPHAQLIVNRWLGGARLWDYMMAQKGYVILTVDNRGSANRGLAFESIIHRHNGVEEMKDQMEGVKLLKNLGYVDMKRLGVHGWSYGGFMTVSLMTTYPEVFKVGVAGGPVIDWKLYEVMYGERYMDMPRENPEGYASTSLIPKAKNLRGKLLIIHGAVDPTVVWQNSLLFLQECIKNQVPVDYFVYPRSEHNVFGMDRIHLMSKITGYFDDYL